MIAVIGKERCACGHPSCKDYWLTGIGKFVQSSGFTEDEADEIIAAVNTARACAAQGPAPMFVAPPEPLDEQTDPDAPEADKLIDLHQRVAGIIRKKYFLHTTNEQKAHETALAVLEEVQRTYEQLAAAANLPTS